MQAYSRSQGDLFEGVGHEKFQCVMADVLIHQVVPSTVYWYIEIRTSLLFS